MHTGLPATMGRCAGGSLPERIASSYILASDTPSLAAACKRGMCEAHVGPERRGVTNAHGCSSQPMG